MSLEEWHSMSQQVKYDFVEDNHFAELKNSEMMRERLQLLQDIENHTGTYFSKDWIKKNILHFNQDEIDDMQADMEQEKANEQDFGPGGGAHPDAPWNQQQDGEPEQGGETS